MLLSDFPETVTDGGGTEVLTGHNSRGLLAAREVMMRFHAKGLLVVAAFAVLVMLAVDVRLGIAAIVAGTVIDWLSLTLPLGFGRSRDRRLD